MLDFSAVANGKPKATKEKKEKVELFVVATIPQIEPVQKELAQYKPQLAELEKQAGALEVKDSETFQMAIDGAGIAKGLIKAINGRVEQINLPHRTFTSQVRTAANFFVDPLNRVAEVFSRKSGDYQYQIELAEKKQQKAIDEANRNLQEKLNKQAEKDHVEAPTVLPVKVAKPATVIHTAGDHSQHLRKPWVGEIVEPEKVERQYCVPSQTLINQAVTQGVREMAGVKIYQKIIPVHK